MFSAFGKRKGVYEGGELSVPVLGKPNLFLHEENQVLLRERETLHVSPGKGRDCGELFGVQKGSIQAFSTAFIIEAYKFLVSQTSPILCKSTLLWSIASLWLYLASHRFVLPSCLHAPPCRSVQIVSSCLGQ